MTSYIWMANAANWDCNCTIPVVLSCPAGVASSLMEISNAFDCVVTLCRVRGILIWGKSPAINHSRCCASGIWHVMRFINTLNRWSKSHADFSGICLISFISVIHCDSDFGFWNSLSNAYLISTSDLSCPGGVVALNFMYHVKALSLNVVSSCAILAWSVGVCFTAHTASQWTSVVLHHLVLSHETLVVSGKRLPLLLPSWSISRYSLLSFGVNLRLSFVLPISPMFTRLSCLCSPLVLGSLEYERHGGLGWIKGWTMFVQSGIGVLHLADLSAPNLSFLLGISDQSRYPLHSDFPLTPLSLFLHLSQIFRPFYRILSTALTRSQPPRSFLQSRSLGSPARLVCRVYSRCRASLVVFSWRMGVPHSSSWRFLGMQYSSLSVVWSNSLYVHLDPSDTSPIFCTSLSTPTLVASLESLRSLQCSLCLLILASLVSLRICRPFLLSGPLFPLSPWILTWFNPIHSLPLCAKVTTQP